MGHPVTLGTGDNVRHVEVEPYTLGKARLVGDSWAAVMHASERARDVVERFIEEMLQSEGEVPPIKAQVVEALPTIASEASRQTLEMLALSSLPNSEVAEALGEGQEAVDTLIDARVLWLEQYALSDQAVELGVAAVEMYREQFGAERMRELLGRFDTATGFRRTAVLAEPEPSPPTSTPSPAPTAGPRKRASRSRSAKARA